MIAALRVVLQDAEARDYQLWWKTHVVNRWVGQLPGAWRRKWRHLRLRADYYAGREAARDNLIAHVRATLAYLEMNRDAIAAQRPWWPFGKSVGADARPVEVRVKDKSSVGQAHVASTTKRSG